MGAMSTQRRFAIIPIRSQSRSPSLADLSRRSQRVIHTEYFILLPYDDNIVMRKPWGITGIMLCPRGHCSLRGKLFSKLVQSQSFFCRSLATLTKCHSNRIFFYDAYVDTVIPWEVNYFQSFVIIPIRGHSRRSLILVNSFIHTLVKQSCLSRITISSTACAIGTHGHEPRFRKSRQQNVNVILVTE